MGHRLILLTAVLAVSLEAAMGTFTRGIGLNGQYYTGAGVGPLGLFRSTAENAQIVSEGFRGHPVGRFLALAYGDEFPNLRDDIIRRLKQQAERNSISTSSGSSSGTSTRSGGGGLFGLLDGPYGAVISPQNWMFDRENNKKELNDPYRRAGLLSSITRGSGSGSGGGGLLSSVTGLLSSFRGGSGSGGSGGGLAGLLGGLGGGLGGSSSSSSSGSSGFRITADTPTRAPSITSIVSELEKADAAASENETSGSGSPAASDNE